MSILIIDMITFIEEQLKGSNYALAVLTSGNLSATGYRLGQFFSRNLNPDSILC